MANKKVELRKEQRIVNDEPQAVQYNITISEERFEFGLDGKMKSDGYRYKDSITIDHETLVKLHETLSKYI